MGVPYNEPKTPPFELRVYDDAVERRRTKREERRKRAGRCRGRRGTNRIEEVKVSVRKAITAVRAIT